MTVYSNTRMKFRVGVEIKPIRANAPVTVVKHVPLRFLRGRVREPGLIELDGGMVGFSVDFDEPDAYELGGRAISHNIWSLDPERAVEGVGWCRGWDGPDVEAFKAHAMLVDSAAC